MDKTIGIDQVTQTEFDFAKPPAAGYDAMRTLGAMVAILGATLGVNVGQALAAQPDEKPGAEQLKLKSGQYKENVNQLKLDAQQQKGVPAVQHKLDATQHKVDANQLKLDSKQLKIDGVAPGK